MSLIIRGIIKGPRESEEDFLKRSCTLSHFPVNPDALQRVEKIFGMRPDWVEVTYSNKGLLPWQGAAVWIGKGHIRLQLRKAYAHKRKLYGLYLKEELIAHELVHAIRMGFDEPKFEEILAYQTSTSSFRRYFGPLFRSSRESLFFLFSLLFLPIVKLFYIPLFLALPCYYLYRLIKHQHIFATVRRQVPLEKMIQMSDTQIYESWRNNRKSPCSSG